MSQQPDLQDPEVRKFLAVWDRVESRFWWRVSWWVTALALGVTIALIIVLLLIGLYLFVQIK